MTRAWPRIVRFGARAATLTIVAGASFLIAFMFGAAGAARAADASDVEAAASAPPPVLEHRRDAPQTTLDDVSRTLMCPSCESTLDQSNSPAASRMRVWVRTAIQEGWTEAEIRDGLVREYGGDESVLAVPRARGAGLLVWVVPAILAAAALLTGVLLVRRWRRSPR